MRRGSSLRLILSPITLVAMVYLRWIISCLRRPLDSRLCRNKAFRCYPAQVGVGLPFQRALRVHLLRRIFERKVALLQSKRLYPKTGDVAVLERYDYMIGMAR